MNEASLLVHGIRLDQYATILAGREDELPLVEVLVLAGVDEADWPEAEEAWARRILEDAQSGGTLAEDLHRATIAALRRWSRPLPPLDEDLHAYLDFARVWAEEPEGDVVLAEHKMHGVDMTRLGALWEERFERDPDLKNRALALLLEPPGPMPKPSPRPAVIVRQEGAL